MDFHYVIDMPNKLAVHFDDFGSPQVCPDVVTVEKLKRTYNIKDALHRDILSST